MSKKKKLTKERILKTGINKEVLTNYTIQELEERGLLPSKAELKAAKAKKKKKTLRSLINKRTRRVNKQIKKI
jgi:hypothetical protein